MLNWWTTIRPISRLVDPSSITDLEVERCKIFMIVPGEEIYVVVRYDNTNINKTRKKGCDTMIWV